MDWTEWIVMSKTFDCVGDVRAGFDAEGHWTLVVMPDRGMPIILSGGCETTAAQLLEQFVSLLRTRETAGSGAD